MKWMLTCFSFSAHSIGDTNYSCTSSIRTDQLDAICYLNSLKKTSWSIRWIETLNNTFYGYKQGILFDFNLSNRQVQVHSGSNSWHIEQWFICCIDNTSIELMCVWVHHKFHLLRMIWLFCGRISSLLVPSSVQSDCHYLLDLNITLKLQNISCIGLNCKVNWTEEMQVFKNLNTKQKVQMCANNIWGFWINQNTSLLFVVIIVLSPAERVKQIQVHNWSECFLKCTSGQ